MGKNQLITTKSTSLILAKSRNLMDLTKSLLLDKKQDLENNNEVVIIGNLMWQKETIGRMKWEDAMEYAKNLKLGGYDDWRLPTVDELGDIVILCGGVLVSWDEKGWREKVDKNNDNAQYQASYREKGFLPNFCWTSSTYANRRQFAWVVYFGSGYDSGYYKSNTYHLRCVRSKY